MCLSVCACVSTYSYEVIKLENIRRINIYIYDEHVPYQSREKEKTRLPRAFAHRSKNTKITGHHDAQRARKRQNVCCSPFIENALYKRERRSLTISGVEGGNSPDTWPGMPA